MSAVTRLAVILLCALAASCSQKPRAQWQEDVQLSDGRVVRIERVQQWDVTQPLGSSKSYLAQSTKVSFAAGTAGPSAWTGGAEVPLLFDVDAASGEFLVVTYPEDCQLYYARGRPKPAYFEYRYRKDRWVPAALSAAALGREPNLLVFPNPLGEPALISLATKADRNRREVVPPVSEIGKAERLPFC